jgi:hypothetical protein
MRQWITIAKIGGTSAAAVAARFGRWAEEVSGKSPAAIRDRADQIDHLVSIFESRSLSAPVLYCCHYLDMWSMGDVFQDLVLLCEPRNLQGLRQEDRELFCYLLPDQGRLVPALRDKLRKKSGRSRTNDELRWLLSSLLEAATSWEGVCQEAAIVMIRQVAGPTVTDEEIQAACAHVPDWLREE